MKVVGVPGDPNIAAVQAAFSALGDLSDQLVLVGGCATGLLADAASQGRLPDLFARMERLAE